MENSSILQEMIRRADAVRQYAHVPFSGFHVGACIRTPNNQLLVGCNYEDPSFSLSICGEASAIAHLIAANFQQIAELVIITDADSACSPCGACRQRLLNLAVPKMKVHLCSRDQVVQATYTIEELLPHPFRFDNS